MIFTAQHKKGFTLIELLVVIGILAVLLAIVLIAINPARQFSQANDTKRRSDINALLNAIHQYAADERGDITPLGLTTVHQLVANDYTLPSWTDGLCSELVPTYIAALPSDPTLGTGLADNGAAVTNCTGVCTVADQTGCYNTGYWVSRSATDNRITVSASGELTLDLSVTR